MPRPARIALLLPLLLSTACAQVNPSQPRADRLADAVTIVRDEWGVPTIYGPTDAAVAFGLGFAQAEDNFSQIEEEYIHALGRAASYYGAAYLPADLVKAAFEIERLSRAEYQREPPQRKAVWDAFAAGLNHYLRVRGVQPRVITRFEPWMPFARFRSVSAGTVVDGVRLGEVSAPSGIVGGEATSPFTFAGAWDDAPLDTARRGLDLTHSSAMWALGRARAANGHALLFYTADAAFFGSAQPYELHLHSDDGWHVRGFATLGTPVPRTAHNEHLAWSHTHSAADHADVYEVTFDHPTDSLMYRFDGGWRRAQSWTDTLLVNTPTGVERRLHTFLKTHHGPVLAWRAGKALAVRVARMTEGGALQQSYALGRATSLEEFRAALAQTSFISTNTLYADREGNIFYVHGNAVPVRDTTFNWSRPVDGSVARSDWQGYHPLADLPQLLNPPSAWLQNSSSSPFLATAREHNLQRARFPSYMAPDSDNARARASRRILERDSAWTFVQWGTAAFDSYVAEADTAIAPLVHEWEQIGGSNPLRALRLDEPLDRLRAWNRTSTIESADMTLFTLWQERLRSGDYTGQYTRFRALEDVVARLERDWRTALVPWGEFNRLQRVHSSAHEPFSDERTSLPVRGGPGSLGVIFHYAAEEVAGSRRRYGVREQSAVGVVELAPTVAARSIVTLGQSGDASSPHYFDQAALYARGELKPAWFARADVMAHARRAYQPVAAQTVR